VEDGAINLDVHTGEISECVGVAIEIGECVGVDLHVRQKREGLSLLAVSLPLLLPMPLSMPLSMSLLLLLLVEA
jgi:hypothetical protein